MHGITDLLNVFHLQCGGIRILCGICVFYVFSICIEVKLSVSDFDGCKIGHIMGLFGGKENVAQKAFVVRHVSVIWIKISDARSSRDT